MCPSGYSRPTALSAANLQIAILNIKKLQYHVFDFRSPPRCGRALYPSGMLRGLERYAVYVLCYLDDEVRSSLDKHLAIMTKFRAPRL